MLEMEENIKLSHVSLAVLGLIAEGESYPYEIMKKIEERQMRDWTNIGQSSIYGVITKLEKKNLIKSKITTSEQNRTKKILTITEKGFSILKKNITSILSKGGRLNKDWDLAFSNIKFLTDDEAIKAFETCLEALIEHRNVLRKKLEAGAEKFDGMPPLTYSGLFSRALKITDANIEFCKETLDALKKGKEAV